MGLEPTAINLKGPEVSWPVQNEIVTRRRLGLGCEILLSRQLGLRLLQRPGSCEI